MICVSACGATSRNASTRAPGGSCESRLGWHLQLRCAAICGRLDVASRNQPLPIKGKLLARWSNHAPMRPSHASGAAEITAAGVQCACVACAAAWGMSMFVC